MSIPLVDLKVQYQSLKGELAPVINRILESGQFIMGPEVGQFEAQMAGYLGAAHAIGVASGTDALLIALLACGIGSGDEVITTPFTFVATAETVVHCGATPVFVDINPHTFNIDAAKIEEKITPRTKAILPVHLYGQAADMEAIMALGRKHKLKVIEDCAQAVGAEYKGKKVGVIGDAGCLSFFPSKNLGAYGDGGMIVTNDAVIAERARIIHLHGAKKTYYYEMHGYNSRLDTIQAGVLSIKLKYLDKWLDMRLGIARRYNQLFEKIDGVEIPYVEKHSKHAFNYYTIRLKGSRSNRDGLRKHLESKGIASAVYYPLSLHLQEIYRDRGYRQGDMPESEAAQEQVLSLPMYPELTPEQINQVVDGIKTYFNK